MGEEVVETGFFETVFAVTCRPFEIRDGFGGVVAREQQIGHRTVALGFQAFGESLSSQTLGDVLCVVEPAECHVAANEPYARFSHDLGFGGVEASEVGESGGGGKEVALLELGFAHEQPGVFEEGVELLAREIGFETRRSVATHFNGGLALDAVQLDGFLTLGDGALEVGFAESELLGVAHFEDGEASREVFAQSVALGFFAVLVGHRGVVEHVVASHERLPPPGKGGVLLRGAAGEQHAEDEEKGREVFDVKKSDGANRQPAGVSCRSWGYTCWAVPLFVERRRMDFIVRARK